ncbi:GIY-YIG nuclease family protein [Parasphingorhabdus flavimaris]|uniref:GIY-YIG nuclease family protein n=1 Tax=Parasphingorhabdus flavimaris TaxID=266812 RepID=A0ABX2MYT4_9SPHN|nr:GIY-YIG nuclease family protein [Parasphingorhabdus flavimaris]NVD26561.1 GIY-YIG nuclease family protein [Parasphingorhabdus flavimaris]
MPFQTCTYIMTNKPRGLPYIGVTSDLLKRIYQHREGIADGFTKRYNLNKLVLFEQFGTMERAILREKQLKRWHRQWKLNLIEATNPRWRDLAEDLGFEPLR